MLNRPDVDFSASICRVLDVSPGELLNIRLSDADFTDRERIIISAYRSRPDLQHAVDILLDIDK